MPYMISAQANFHWVKSIRAETNSSGVLKLVLHGAEVTDEQFNTAEIVIFTENPEMVKRLVAAINNCAAEPDVIEPAPGSLA